MLDKQKQQRRMLPMAEFALMLVEKNSEKGSTVTARNQSMAR